MINEEKFVEVSPRLYDIGRTLFNQYQQQLIQADAVASGALLNGKWDIERDENHLSLIFFLQDYWKTIEYGRQPTKNAGDGTVRQKIKQWIITKGIQIKPKENGKIQSIDSVSFAIAKKIHKEGYKSRYPLEKALNNNKALINEFVDLSTQMFDAEIATEINELYKI